MTRWLFGKLPALGDFVARGLDMAARDRLDAWLSAEMDGARTQWGDAFEPRYDAAPAWTFVDQDDAGTWYAGALCASMDRAGRRFPLLAAASVGSLAEAPAMAAAWIEAMVQGFASGWDADALFAAVLAPAPLPWQPAAAEWALVGEDGPAVRLAGSRPAGILNTMLELAG